jgi:hypothetical protein
MTLYHVIPRCAHGRLHEAGFDGSLSQGRVKAKHREAAI